MNVEDLLITYEPAIVEEAAHATEEIARYGRDGTLATRRRIEELYHRLTDAIRARDVSELLAYVRQIARERSEAGFELSDVQAAFDALEDAIWHGAVAELPAYDLPFGHGLVCTALAHGKETLRHAFDPAAPHVPAPFPDLTPLYRGTQSVLAPCPSEEMVFAA
ncbi:RsbRD N-terminal domain-containing protein [Anaeromyxobacter terrae]|uniref:RsbRD N-terminal domain-containing protein n=1 Tax=Anaeromyxobacter terrae TaxID=2925406 RepID=UPI001F5A7745|nr:RsbRD N-terminal domain-containing protein [Anaeromyxobacter sp. SG22]